MDDKRFSSLSNAISIEFLLTDLDVALTFMDISEATSIKETARRNHINARNAYDMVLALLRNHTLHAIQQNALDGKLATLKARLHAVGMF